MITPGHKKTLEKSGVFCGSISKSGKGVVIFDLVKKKGLSFLSFKPFDLSCN